MDSITPNLSDHKTQELRRKLLACLDREARQFSSVARTYFTCGQLSEEDRVGLLRAVIDTVNHVCDAGDWESSLFLRNTIKPLTQIKAEAETELAKLSAKAEDKVSEHAKPLSKDEVEVYVSLFQSDGYNISKWSLQLRSLDRYVVGRPVYGSETDVLARLRARGQAAGNEAYVIVVVKKTDVLPKGDSKDQYDYPLITLKEKALKSGRIIGFVHQGTRYQFVEGQLLE